MKQSDSALRPKTLMGVLKMGILTFHNKSEARKRQEVKRNFKGTDISCGH